jgi:hypothetical protein
MGIVREHLEESWSTGNRTWTEKIRDKGQDQSALSMSQYQNPVPLSQIVTCTELMELREQGHGGEYPPKMVVFR